MPLPLSVMLNSFQHPSCLRDRSVQAEKWTLKQVQGDVERRVIPTISPVFAIDTIAKKLVSHEDTKMPQLRR